MRSVEGNFAATYAEVPLPLERIPTRDDLQKELSSTDKYVAHRAELLLAQLDAGRPIAERYPYPVQTWHIGSVVWVFLGGEVVVDYSLRLKQEFDHRPLRIFGYANDVMAYIPSRRVLAEGGYEGREAMVYYGLPSARAPDIEQLILDEVCRQMRKAPRPVK
jgi:neutral ceramidase